MHQINFSQLVKDNLHFQEERKYFKYSKNHLFQQLLMQLIAGYSNDTAANTLAKDASFTLVLDQLVSSQPTLSRYINRISENELDGVSKLSEKLAQLVIKQRKQEQLILDLDSTHSDTYGKQKGSSFNAHYNDNANGYHPLLAFDQLFGCLLGAKLRPGNLYTSNGAEDFLLPILQNYANQDILVRADSGFAKSAIYAACETVGAKFVIRLKANKKLQKIAEHLIMVDSKDCAETEIQYHTLRNYRVDSWEKPYTVIVKSTRPESEFLFRHEFIVTNLEKTFPQDVYQLYQQRDTMEDLIKEVKADFFCDKTDSSTFVANHFRMLLSGVAYNLIQAMKMLVLPDKLEQTTISSLRFKLLHLAAKVTRHAHKVWVQVSSSNVFDDLYWQCLFRVHHLNLIPA